MESTPTPQEENPFVSLVKLVPGVVAHEPVVEPAEVVVEVPRTVRAGMTPEERLAILMAPITDIPPRRIAHPTTEDPFGLLEHDDTYAVMAGELFNECERMAQAVMEADPMLAAEPAASRGTVEQPMVFPTVHLTEYFSFGMKRADTKAATVYSFTRRDAGYEDRGFDIMANDDGCMLLATPYNETNPEPGDDDYYTLLMTGQKWLQDYAVGLKIDRPEPTPTPKPAPEAVPAPVHIPVTESQVPTVHPIHETRVVYIEVEKKKRRGPVFRIARAVIITALAPSLVFNAAGAQKGLNHRIAEGLHLSCHDRSDLQLAGIGYEAEVYLTDFQQWMRTQEFGYIGQLPILDVVENNDDPASFPYCS